ncbi:MAG: DUF5686 and carboxypeptidase regulatory-like domain-containing protein, partial [Flavobacteriaceae bacterium]
CLLILFLSGYCNAQITGKVTNVDQEPLPFVNIYIEGTLDGTTTNDSGIYELDLPKKDQVVIVFKYLGFKTLKKTIDVGKDGYELNVVLIEEGVELTGVELVADANPAIEIMRNTIATRKKIKEKITNYTARFYSKGLIKIKNAPERILGMDLGDFGGGLDSTRTGIVYLSETISEIAQAKGALKEKILASKISGDDNGFSFNAAMDVNFSLYDNTVELGGQLISPLAENAFSYYTYRLKGTFYDDGNRLINQIEVRPKRPQDKTFSGTIYIVEDEWALYAVDLQITGKQAQIAPVDTLHLKQNFNYSKKYDAWLKVLQSLDFEYSILGFKGDGRFTAGYKDYNLAPHFTRGDFNSEILSFGQNANTKDSLFWQDQRPVPLTLEESGDYKLKDSVQTIRKTQKYLDSVDATGNKPKLSSLFFGYTYSNSFKKKYFTVTTPMENINFNTVQGWHGSFGLSYLKLFQENESRAFQMKALVNYGLSDKRFRPTATLNYRFNKISRPIIRLNLGNEARQFNNDEPISPLGNSTASLFFERNFAKFYDRTFLEFIHSQEIINGLQATINLGYEDRKPLFNQSDFTFFDSEDRGYTSNHPLEPGNFESAVIENHTIAKLNIDLRIRFGQQYLNYPDEKINIANESYPSMFLGYEKGFASSSVSNHFSQLKIRLEQSFNVANKGRFSYNLRAGTFINADDISFVDYQHFNGNETYVTRKAYTESFFLLPYYAFSTNRKYFEGHVEHNFNGFIMNRIPLLKHLNAHLIINGNLLVTTANKPYSEFGIALGNLGIKKFRFLRVGYVQNYFNGSVERNLNLGLQF